MEFFREHKKFIVGFITISFILWTAGLGLMVFISGMGR